LLLALAACPAPVSNVITPPGAENCTNGIDDNGDGKIDCLDPKCIETSSCVFGEICDNARDDNNNRQIDCADPQCEGQACGFNCLCVGGAKQIFDGSKDSGVAPRDAGRPVDSGTPMVDAGTPVVDAGTPVVDSGTPVVDAGTDPCAGCNAGCTCTGGVRHEANCGDLADNDGDLAFDCADSDCATAMCGPGCTCAAGVKKETLCNDGIDNDGSGGIDCADSDCAAQSCGPGCSCAAGVKKETLCNDGVDNDGSGGIDCADSDCAAQSCGTGCQCVGSAKKELLCADAADNDGDGSADCADSDCVGAGTEVCNDGLDNTCDRAVDCADPKCSGQCANLNDGLPCIGDGQCAGGKCLSEAATGLPNGFCSNATSCTLGSNLGCHGGFCRANGASNICRAPCTGTGTGSTGRCRTGYACFDPDGSSGTANSYCLPHCTADVECAGSGAGYGCNSFSKRCEAKDKSRKGYGAACTSETECEGGFCLAGPNFPGNYCSGPCRNDLMNCGVGGMCDKLASPTDNVSVCLKRCDDFSQCTRASEHYGCFYFTPPQVYSACQCLPSGNPVYVYMGTPYPLYCCSGSVTGSTCN